MGTVCTSSDDAVDVDRPVEEWKPECMAPSLDSRPRAGRDAARAEGSGGGDSGAGEERGKSVVVGSGGEPVVMSPVEIGRKVGQIYLNCMAQVHERLSMLPLDDSDGTALGEVERAMANLKEEAVQKLVILGYQRNSLGRAERSKVDGVVENLAQSVPAEDWNYLAGAVTRFMFSQPRLSRTLSSFNNITQYAAFEVLLAQEPEEAKRLEIPSPAREELET